MMKSINKILILLIICFNSAFVFASEPVITYDVRLLQNATQAQCMAAQNADVGPVHEEVYSSAGEYDGDSGPGVRSCSGCKVDYSTKDCICRTCYSYFN